MALRLTPVGYIWSSDPRNPTPASTSFVSLDSRSVTGLRASPCLKWSKVDHIADRRATPGLQLRAANFSITSIGFPKRVPRQAGSRAI